jgi:hypothetical protein
VADADLGFIRRRQILFEMATVSSVQPSQVELDSLECSSIFRGLIPTFKGDGRTRPAAIAIHGRDMIR